MTTSFLDRDQLGVWRLRSNACTSFWDTIPWCPHSARLTDSRKAMVFCTWRKYHAHSGDKQQEDCQKASSSSSSSSSQLLGDKILKLRYQVPDTTAQPQNWENDGCSRSMWILQPTVDGTFLWNDDNNKIPTVSISRAEDWFSTSFVGVLWFGGTVKVMLKESASLGFPSSVPDQRKAQLGVPLKQRSLKAPSQ